MHETLPPPILSPRRPAEGAQDRRRGAKNAARYGKRRQFAPLLIVTIIALLPATIANAKACPPSPAPIRELDLARYYSDKAGTKIDETKRLAKRAAVAPLKSFMSEVAKGADGVWRTSQPHSANAACPLSWLTAWAKSDALLGKMPSKQADYERKWALAGLAMSYVKLRPFATTAQRETMDPWLIRLADQCRAFFDDPGRKRNNHWYWLGLGMAAVGLATGSERHWDEARRIMQDAANAIQPDGTLPMELSRGKRALHYHNFSAQPLFAMTLLTRAKGEDWTAYNDAAFTRLVRFISAAICFAKPIAGLEALPRQDAVREKNFEAGWLQDYVRLNPKIEAAKCAPNYGTSARPSDDHRLGGDLGALIRALDVTYK